MADDPHAPRTEMMGRMGIGEGARVWIGGRNREARREVEKRLRGIVRPTEGLLDALIICPETPDEAAYFCGKHAPRLAPGGRVWVVYPANDTAHRAAAGEKLAGLSAVGGETFEIGNGYVASGFLNERDDTDG